MLLRYLIFCFDYDVHITYIYLYAIPVKISKMYNNPIVAQFNRPIPNVVQNEQLSNYFIYVIQNPIRVYYALQYIFQLNFNINDPFINNLTI